MDFASIDQKLKLKRRNVITARANTLGFSYVSQFVHDRYCVQGKSPKKIAWELRVSYQSIYRWLSAWGFVPLGADFTTDYSPAASFRGEVSYAPIQLQAVRELWAEVLKQALKDIKDDNKEASGALSWLMNTQNEDCPSFVWVAELFGFDPVAVRKAVLYDN